MKVRTKIIFVIIPVLMLVSLLINLAFGLFFKNHLESQEKAQVYQIGEGLASFINEKSIKYRGSVTDWAHWEDTHRFINDGDVSYVDKNLQPPVFTNLDVNFIIFLKEDGSLFYKLYYDLEKQDFSPFPQGFFDDFENILAILEAHPDLFGICRLGGGFFFAASADVTRGVQSAQANGKMIIGRLIDETVVSALEKATGCGVVSLEKTTKDLPGEPGQTMLHGLSINDKNDALMIEFAHMNPYDDRLSVLFSLVKKRDYYISGIRQIQRFALVSMWAMGLVLFTIFVLLSRHLSKPLAALIRDLGEIRLSGKEDGLLCECGNDEFLFLRKTINEMLLQIEAQQAAVRDSEEKLLATLISVGDGVVVIDRDYKIQFMNPVAQNLTGWTRDDAINESFDTVFRIENEYTRAPVDSPVKEVFETERIVALANHTVLIARDGAEKPIEDTAAPIRDKSGKVTGCVLVFKDSSEKKEKQKRIEFLSYRDQLTGLYNRRYFEEAVDRTDTEENLPISFMYADVNGLKTINDAFGHQSGDRLIVRVAEEFMAECGANGTVSRTGGDEFIVMLPKTDSLSVERMSLRIREKIEQTKIMDIGVSVSIGWATKDAPDQATWEVLKNAENYMYKKKIKNSSHIRSTVIQSVFDALKLKSPPEEAHAKRVALICEEIGRALGLCEEDIRELKKAGEMHDIGKISVDTDVLNKPGRLYESEWVQIRSHPETGYRILGTSSEYYDIAEYVLAHHERWDGTGYPKGLKGESIHWKARVIAIADSYEIMTCGRSYKKALTREEAAEEIMKNAGTQFDPDLSLLFVEQIIKKL